MGDDAEEAEPVEDSQKAENSCVCKWQMAGQSDRKCTIKQLVESYREHNIAGEDGDGVIPMPLCPDRDEAKIVQTL